MELHSVQPYLEQYGYVAVFAAVLGEDFGLPLPGETLLIAGSVLASQGHLSIGALLAWAWAGAVLGDNIGYLIGAFGGRALVLRFGRYLFLDGDRLAAVEGFFARHGGKVVVAARFFEGLRQLNGVVAGIARMPWTLFLVFNALGAALWVGLWGVGGYLLGGHLHGVLAQLRRFEGSFWQIALGLGLLLVGYLAWRHLRGGER
jgi:membrane protein DedA with SNARE-associated domain